MRIYADLRCLQDENYAFRGVGYHTSVLLSQARAYFPRSAEIVGLIDEAMSPLPDEYAALVDRTDCVFAADSHDPGVFVQFSPMTHAPEKASRLIGRPHILSCAVVYDFIPLDVPERYLPTDSAVGDYLSQLHWLAAYEHFFPISAYSGNRLHDLLPVDRSQIHVVGVALRPDFEQTMSGVAQPAAYSGVAQPYVLFVGGGDARKNLDVLIRAFADLQAKRSNVSLAIVGKYTPAQMEAFAKAVETFGGDRAMLRFLEHVSDAELAGLYRNALCTVCSSRIEGFSLPIIEAPACGCPLLASDNDAHRELLGTSGVHFAPEDASKLAELLKRVVVDRVFRAELIGSQQQVPQRFTAKAVGERFWLPIASLLRERRRTASLAVPTTPRERRPRIAIVSPFPPDRSGVADYTRRTVQALGKLADVDVYTDAVDPTPTPEVRAFRPISEWPYVSGSYDTVISVIGNSHFHLKAIELHKQYGGPCLIHDNRLAELYHWWKGPEYFRQMACRSLGRHVAVSESDRWIAHPGELPSVFFDELIPMSRPLIVHSRGIQSQCKKQYGIEAAYLPFCCYREFPTSTLTPAARRRARAELGISPDQIVVVSLGLVGPSKSPELCIQSMARLRDAGLDAHLYFVGSPGGMQSRLQDWANASGVADRVHLCGDWISEQDYYRYVQAADFAIQLRGHFFGGLSGAMLDCIGGGITTVANEDLAEALDSPETVLRVPDAPTCQDIVERVLQAYRAGMHKIRLHPSRQRYLQEHCFDRYALKMLECLGFDVPMSEKPLDAAAHATSKPASSCVPAASVQPNLPEALEQRLHTIAGALLRDDTSRIQHATDLLDRLRDESTDNRQVSYLLHQLFLARIPTRTETLRLAKYLQFESSREVMARFTTSEEFKTGAQAKTHLQVLGDQTLAIDVSHTLTYPHNSGIQRVVRSLALCLADDNADHALVRFDESLGAYRLLSEAECLTVTHWEARHAGASPLSVAMPRAEQRKALKRWAQRLAGDRLTESIRKQLRTWKEQRREARTIKAAASTERIHALFLWKNRLLFPELMSDHKRLEATYSLLSHAPLQSSMVLYDLIPLVTPDLCQGNVDGFVRYLTLLRLVDRVSCISNAVKQDVERFLQQVTRSKPLTLAYHHLGADFERLTESTATAHRLDVPLVLVVGTFELRKNHRRILRAMAEAHAKGAKFRGVFVGNPGWMCDDFVEEVAYFRSRGVAVETRQSVSEAELMKLYSTASFSVFCSLAEGFGLPIVESIAKGVPCITSNRGSMLELASSLGGCVVVNPESETDIAAAIQKLVTDRPFFERLKQEAAAATTKSWSDYSRELFAFASSPANASTAASSAAA